MAACTLMPLEGDEGRLRPAQIPHPRLGGVSRDHVRSVGAERGGEDRTLMPLEGDEGRPRPAQIPHQRRVVFRLRDHMRSVGAERGERTQP